MNEKQLQELKRDTHLRVPIAEFGALRPVRADADHAERMATWRTAAWQSFFTWVQPTEEDMLKWLRQYERRANDFMFTIERPDNHWGGQLALYDIDVTQKTAEYGRIIKNPAVKCPGLMRAASSALLKWGFEKLKLSRVVLEVFADNKAAIRLYEQLGFSVCHSFDVYKTQLSDGTIQWRKTPGHVAEAARSAFRYEITLAQLQTISSLT